MIKSYKVIWVILLSIILFTSLTSGITWDNYGKQRFASSITQNLSYMKEMIKEMKSLKMELINGTNTSSQQITFLLDDKDNLLTTSYFDEEEKIFIIEYYDKNIIIKNEYYIHRGFKPDVIELDTDMDGTLNTAEYYFNNYNIPDVIEHDNNNDGIIDEMEIIINVDGKFIPLSSFGNIIL